MHIDYLTLPVDPKGSETIHLAFIVNEGALILIDAGYPNMLPLIAQQLEEKGCSLNALSQIWLTHHDHDHVGSLAQLKHRYPQVKIYASAIERPFIEGSQPSLRLQQAQAMQAQMLEEQQAAGEAFQAYLRTIEPCAINGCLSHRQSLLEDNVIVFDTKGHTEGHLAFYLPHQKTLVSGDMVVVDGGKLALPFPEYAFDAQQAKTSILAISHLPIHTVICYHGGVRSASEEEIKAELVAAAR